MSSRKLTWKNPQSIGANADAIESFALGVALPVIGVTLLNSGAIALLSVDRHSSLLFPFIGIVAIVVGIYSAITRTKPEALVSGGLLSVTAIASLFLAPVWRLYIVAGTFILLIGLIIRGVYDEEAVYPYAIFYSLSLGLFEETRRALIYATLIFGTALVVFLYRKNKRASLAMIVAAVVFGLGMFLGIPDDRWTILSAVFFLLIALAAAYYEMQVDRGEGENLGNFAKQFSVIALIYVGSLFALDDEIQVLRLWAILVSVYQLGVIFIQRAQSGAFRFAGIRISWIVLTACIYFYGSAQSSELAVAMLINLLLVSLAAILAYILGSSFLSTASLFIAALVGLFALDAIDDNLSPHFTIVALVSGCYLTLGRTVRPLVDTGHWWHGLLRARDAHNIREFFSKMVSSVRKLPLIGLIADLLVAVVRWMIFIKGNEERVRVSDVAFVLGVVISVAATVRQLDVWFLGEGSTSSNRLLLIAPICSAWGAVVVIYGRSIRDSLARVLGFVILVFPIAYLVLTGNLMDKALFIVVGLSCGSAAWICTSGITMAQTETRS